MVPAVIAQVFNLFTELVIPIDVPTNEAKVQIETQSIAAEMRETECSKQFKLLHAL